MTGRAVDERWHVKKDGSRFWASGVLSALRDHDGSLLGFAKVLRDITERRREQEELADAYARLGEAYAREQRTAEVLQRSVLLGTSAPAFEGLEFSAQYESASDDLLVGGDFFDAFRLADGRAAFVVGDVVGKGLYAAAHTAQIKFALRVLLREYPQPATAVQRLNSFLYEADQLDSQGSDTESRFVVLCVGVIDPVSGAGALAGAGIEPPLILRASGETESILTDGVPLGMVEKAQYNQTALHLGPGDVVLLTTDGGSRRRGQGREFLDYEGLTRLARQSLLLPSLDAMGKAIVEGARVFGGGVFRDDVCLLLARRS